jgi:hypothetical protein
MFFFPMDVSSNHLYITNFFLYKKKLEQNTKLKQAKVELVTFNTLIKQFYKKKPKVFLGESRGRPQPSHGSATGWVWGECNHRLYRLMKPYNLTHSNLG